MKKLKKEDYIKIYSYMMKIRRFEERAAQLYGMGHIGGFCHLYIGQEAVVVGVLMTINTNDSVVTTYRDHGHMIARGLDPRKIMAELTGRQDGYSSGKGGSMHMFSKEHNFFGGHGIVGGQVPLGAGIAFADKYNENDAVTLCYMGDGAVRQGAVHEAFNMAMMWKLPVVFICENNGYAMGTSVERTANHSDIWKLGLSYEMPCAPVDGMDPVAVAESVKEAVDRARKGDGPTFLEMKTYRYKGHSMSDAQKYRTKDEVAEYQKIDPITKVLDMIKKNKWATDKEIQAIQDQVKATVKEAVDFAETSPFPSNDSLYQNVYAEEYPFIKE